MPLQEFTRDIVPILQLAVGVLGLLSLFLLWWQLRQTNMWHKLNSPHNFIQPATNSELERMVYDSLKKTGLDVTNLNRNLTQAEVDKIIEDDDAFFSTKAFLNDFENLGAALSTGIADPDLTYAVHSSRLLRAYKLFRPFIETLREKHDDHEIYIEIEKTALKWERKHISLAEGQKRRVKELKAALAKEQGAQRKV